jgi:hypothetical protein
MRALPGHGTNPDGRAGGTAYTALAACGLRAIECQGMSALPAPSGRPPSLGGLFSPATTPPSMTMPDDQPAPPAALPAAARAGHGRGRLPGLRPARAAHHALVRARPQHPRLAHRLDAGRRHQRRAGGTAAATSCARCSSARCGRAAGRPGAVRRRRRPDAPHHGLSRWAHLQRAGRGGRQARPAAGSRGWRRCTWASTTSR